jgi:hypothetical protein
MIQFRELSLISNLSYAGAASVLGSLRKTSPASLMKPEEEIFFGELLVLEVYRVLCDSEFLPDMATIFAIIQEFGEDIHRAGDQWLPAHVKGTVQPTYALIIADRRVVTCSWNGERTFAIDGRPLQKDYTPFEGISYNLSVLAERLYQQLLTKGLLDDNWKVKEDRGDPDQPGQPPGNAADCSE